MGKKGVWVGDPGDPLWIGDLTQPPRICIQNKPARKRLILGGSGKGNHGDISAFRKWINIKCIDYFEGEAPKKNWTQGIEFFPGKRMDPKKTDFQGFLSAKKKT